MGIDSHGFIVREERDRDLFLERLEVDDIAEDLTRRMEELEGEPDVGKAIAQADIIICEYLEYMGDSRMAAAFEAIPRD